MPLVQQLGCGKKCLVKKMTVFFCLCLLFQVDIAANQAHKKYDVSDVFTNVCDELDDDEIDDCCKEEMLL